MITRHSRLVCIGVVIWLWSGAGLAVGSDAGLSDRQGKTHSSPKEVSLVNELLECLPPDTETLSVAQGRFKISAQKQNEPDHPSLEWWLRAWRGLHSAEGPMAKAFKGRTVVLAAEGSRRFHIPAGLGSGHFEGCYFWFFDHDSARNFELKTLKPGSQLLRIKGHDVVYFKEMVAQFRTTARVEKQEWNVYFASPRPDLILQATHLGYLEEVLDRIQRKGKGRAFPEDLPEWKHVDVEAPFWAIRHYVKPDTDLDSGLYVDPIGDAGVTGMTFSFNPSKGQSVKLSFIDAKEESCSIIKEVWSQGDLKLKTKRDRAGVLQVTIELEGENAAAWCYGFLLIALGHPICV
jgi:hypothetical protein